MVLILLLLLSLVVLKLIFFKYISLDIIVLTCAMLVLVAYAFQYGRKDTEHYTEDPQSYQRDVQRIKFLNNLLTPVDGSATGTSTGTSTGSGSGSGTVVGAASQNSSSVPSGAQQPPASVLADISPITQNLQMYLTSYNTGSYSGSGNTWYNIAPKDSGTPSQTCSPQGDLVTLDSTFAAAPVTNPVKGLYFGTNSATGPPSYAMGINGNGEFTLFFVVQFDALSANDANIFQIYGNSTDNDGLSVGLTAVSSSPTQTGTLTVTFAGDDYAVSKVAALDSTLVYLFVLTKTLSTISLTQYSSASSSPVVLLSAPLQTTDLLFSNKNMVFNRDSNFNAYMKAFGAYNYALADTDVSNLYTYFLMEEKKQDTVIQQYQATVNALTQSLSNLSACPLDTTTCNACGSINDWSQHQQIITADPNCRTSIDAYCSANTSNNAFCSCWDSTDSNYTLDQCYHFRSIFNSNNAGADFSASNLSPAALDLIKQQYNLQEIDINLEEDPNTGALVAVDINTIPNTMSNINVITTAATAPTTAGMTGGVGDIMYNGFVPPDPAYQPTTTPPVPPPSVGGPIQDPAYIQTATATAAQQPASVQVAPSGVAQPQYITAPVRATPSGFLDWMSSWF